MSRNHLAPVRIGKIKVRDVYKNIFKTDLSVGEAIELEEKWEENPSMRRVTNFDFKLFPNMLYHHFPKNKAEKLNPSRRY